MHYGLFLHGVGTQRAGYSAKAREWLTGVLPAFASQEVVWAPVLDAFETDMLATVKRGGSNNRPMQRFVVNVLADALSYRHRQDQIFELIDQSYCRLRAPGGVTIFAHSLGALLALEWLRARPTVQVDKLVTFGVNLQLFYLGGDFVSPAQVAAPGCWVNAFSDTDALGWPLRGWLPHVRDVEVNVGGLFSRWNGLAHTAYFDSRRFWRNTVPSLL